MGSAVFPRFKSHLFGRASKRRERISSDHLFARSNSATLKVAPGRSKAIGANPKKRKSVLRTLFCRLFLGLRGVCSIHISPAHATSKLQVGHLAFQPEDQTQILIVKINEGWARLVGLISLALSLSQYLLFMEYIKF